MQGHFGSEYVKVCVSRRSSNISGSGSLALRLDESGEALCPAFFGFS